MLWFIYDLSHNFYDDGKREETGYPESKIIRHFFLYLWNAITNFKTNLILYFYVD